MQYLQWIWLPHQEKIESLIKTLGVQTFLQPDDPSSTRIVGGSFAMVQALSNSLPQENVKLDFPVVACKQSGEGTIVLTSASGDTILAKQIVFAVPPRILGTVCFHTTVCQLHKLTPPMHLYCRYTRNIYTQLK